MTHPQDTPLRAMTRMGLLNGVMTAHAVALRDPLAQIFTGSTGLYAAYDRIRDHGPVVRSTTGGWASADYAACAELLRRRDLEVRLPQPWQNTVDLSLLTTDPPEHTRLRRLVAGAFSPARIRALEPLVQQAVDTLLDRLADELLDGPADLIHAFAKPLPVAVISALLGVPDAEHSALAAHGDAIGSVLGGIRSPQHYREVVRAREHMHALADRLATARRANPGTDLTSDLVRALDAGELTLVEYHGLITLLLIAGFETTVNLIGNTIVALLDRPDTWRRIVAEPDLAARAVEETLRWDSPAQAVARIPRAETEVCGVRLPKNAIVSVLIGGANRDPDVFPSPQVFDIDRPNAADHLAFSQGVHHCLGHVLARLEARLAVVGLATRFPGLLAAVPARRGRGWLLRGHTSVPVSYRLTRAI